MSLRSYQGGNKKSGFTLLEVLVALAVLAISALAVINQTGQSLTQLQRLQAKTIATVVAENRLRLLHINPQWPGVGRQSLSISFAEQQWLVETEVTNTSEPWLRKIEVTVSHSDFTSVAGSNSRSTISVQPIELVSLIAYRGLH
jgi:general secretion pathway protein I